MPIIYASLQPSFSKLPVGDILSQAITSQPPSLFPCDIHSPLILFPDTMATYCIVVGVVLAALTLIGLIASYCGWHKMLKIVSRFKRYEICTNNRIVLSTNVSLPPASMPSFWEFFLLCKSSLSPSFSPTLPNMPMRSSAQRRHFSSRMEMKVKREMPQPPSGLC